MIFGLKTPCTPWLISLLLTVFLLAGGNLYAQSVPGQLGAEIQTLEQKLTPAASPAERHNALVRLAKLRQLSGNIAEAAANWLDAAAADPQDADALVSGAYCLAAIGEWEKAAAAIRPLLASGRAEPVMPQAWFLDACLRAWSAGDASALIAPAAHPDFAVMRPLIYYTLWQTLTRNPEAAVAAAGSAESWKSRLLAEFPQSPEARAADSGRLAGSANAKDSPVVSAVQSPLWQLLPGKAAAATAKPVTPAPAAPAVSTPAKPTPAPATSAASAPAKPTAAPTVSAPPPSTPTTSPAPASGVVLQTGLFSREANARTQYDALRKAGFTALISRKLVNGVEHWAVTVPAGQDQRKTTADLKKAGFDSFPVK
jgi:cell division septation protein DedD